MLTFFYLNVKQFGDSKTIKHYRYYPLIALLKLVISCHLHYDPLKDMTRYFSTNRR